MGEGENRRQIITWFIFSETNKVYSTADVRCRLQVESSYQVPEIVPYCPLAVLEGHQESRPPPPPKKKKRKRSESVKVKLNFQSVGCYGLPKCY
jgi:hypothetical protein